MVRTTPVKCLDCILQGCDSIELTKSVYKQKYKHLAKYLQPPLWFFCCSPYCRYLYTTFYHDHTYTDSQCENNASHTNAAGNNLDELGDVHCNTTPVAQNNTVNSIQKCR